MAVRANLIVGAVGAGLALVSGSIIAVNWEALAGLETWEARFETHDVRLPDRLGTLTTGATRNEIHALTTDNVTRLQVDLTWRDPAINPPEVTLRILDPSRKVRAEESHTGGSTGIHLEVILLASADVPTGSATYRVRGDARDLHARNEFESRWPTHREGNGQWMLELRSAAPDNPGPAASVTYTLRADYSYYTGTFSRVPEPVR